MPISIVQFDPKNTENQKAAEKILKTLPDGNDVLETWSEFSNGAADQEAWLAIFNERKVALAIISDNRLVGIAVHGATLGRGVAKRVIDLLVAERPNLTVDYQAIKLAARNAIA